MTELSDGTVLQDGIRFEERTLNPGDRAHRIYYPVVGQITKVAAPDDPENYPGETYLCDVHVTEMGIDLFQVPWTLDKAGPDNYVHYGPVAAEYNLDGSIFSDITLDPEVSNGDTVIVVFAYGDVHRPYIIKVLPHNQSGPGGMSPDPRPTEDDGDCFKVRYNGTNLLIDKDGNFRVENTATLNPLIPRQKLFEVEWSNALGQAHTLTLDMNPGVETARLEHSTGSFIEMAPNGDITAEHFGGNSFSVTAGSIIWTHVSGSSMGIAANGDIQLDHFADNHVTVTATDITALHNTGSSSGIDAAGDIRMDNYFGDNFRVSAADGIQGFTPAGGGTSLSMVGGQVDLAGAAGVSVSSTLGDIEVESTAGAVSLKGSGGAAAKFEGGLIALGNAAEELVNLLYETVNTLSTTTAAGFGAPLSSAPAFVALLARITAIKGSL